MNIYKNRFHNDGVPTKYIICLETGIAEARRGIRLEIYANIIGNLKRQPIPNYQTDITH